MADLSPKQMLFVQAYLKNSNITAAAISAGYSERSASVTGSRMLKNANILAFLAKKEAKLDRDLRELFVEDALIAYNVLKEIMNKPEAQDKDRLVAARDLLDRAGYKPIDRVIADVNSEVVNRHEYHITQTIQSDPESAEALRTLYKRQIASALDSSVGNTR